MVAESQTSHRQLIPVQKVLNKNIDFCVLHSYVYIYVCTCIYVGMCVCVIYVHILYVSVRAQSESFELCMICIIHLIITDVVPRKPSSGLLKRVLNQRCLLYIEHLKRCLGYLSVHPSR